MKGLGMSGRVCATGIIKDPVPPTENSWASSPGGRFHPIFIHQVIISGLNNLWLHVLVLKMALDADIVSSPQNSNSPALSTVGHNTAFGNPVVDPRLLGSVWISITDRPTGHSAMENSRGRWSVSRLDSPPGLLKHPPVHKAIDLCVWKFLPWLYILWKDGFTLWAAGARELGGKRGNWPPPPNFLSQ